MHKKEQFCKVHMVISILQREYSDANGAIFITVYVIERKQHEPPRTGSGDLTVLSSAEEVKGHVFFFFQWGFILQPQHAAAAPWLYVPRNEHIHSSGLHSITTPWVGACSHEDIKMWFSFTVGSLPDDVRKLPQRQGLG